MKKHIILLLFLLVLLPYLYSKNNAKMVFYGIDLRKDISSTTWIYIQKGFLKAQQQHADKIIISMNTYGGEVVYADSIRTKILHSSIPVIVFIDNNAASAGALISIAADKIYMRASATIGAASVVNQTGEKMPDKYQSYMRATMRATAEYHGKDTIITDNDTTYQWKRNPIIAEAMVDERTSIPNIVDSTKVLTFTTKEALENGYCDEVVENIEQLLTKEADGQDYKFLKYEPNAWDNIKGLLTSPYLQSILIMLIIGGLYFEMQSPGIGFALLVSIAAAILYFAPLYIEGLASNWEVILFIIGLILIALEVFVVPGFGVTGITGLILTTTGLTLSLLNNVHFDFQPVEKEDTSKAILIVTSGITLGIGLILYLSHKIGSKGAFETLALKTILSKEEGYTLTANKSEQLTNKQGIATTDLRPSGKVTIEDNKYDAISLNGTFIEKGKVVKVQKESTSQIYVVEQPTEQAKTDKIE